jgi:TetR/AcrR family transcriptional regulator, transcriptional repressor for nem operon
MNDSKELILNTSLKLFLQKNFKEVTMKEIVTETGLSKGAFYHYFSSKEQVFEEVIQFFYGDVMSVAFSTFSKDSLQDFYNEYLEHMEQKMITTQNSIGLDFASNHYMLIFDALKMLPNFRAEHQERQKEELKAWVDIVKAARKKGEIKSVMTDAQIAKLFIYSGDGMGINYIVSDSLHKIVKELKALWDGLFTVLKA